MPTKTPPRRLTETYVKGLKFDGRGFIVRDTAVIGLMVNVNKTWTSYKVQRDLWAGRPGRRKLVKTVRHTLGTTDTMSLDEARTRAQEVIAGIKRGVDPNAPSKTDDTGAWTVGKMFEEYRKDMATRDCVERSIRSVGDRFDLYLFDWENTPITEIKRSTARERHQHITVKHGPRVANMSMKDYKAAYNFALRIVNDPDALPDNPIKAVTFNKERSSNKLIMPEDLPDWWDKVGKLSNPIRRAMHRLGLLSGLRPGTLVSLRREWIRLNEHAIVIPRMKSGREFALPLSPAMEELVREAIQAGDVFYPKSQWLFPTRGKQGAIIATQVWKERDLPSETGHLLRHTYRTLAQRLGVDDIDGSLLVDHKVKGITGVYLHATALFDRLLAQQTRMSEYILMLTKKQELRKAAE